MRARDIAGEIRRGVASGTARVVLLALMAAVVGIVAVAADLATVRQLTAEAAAFHAAGGSTMIIIAPARVDGEACERLTEVPGVEAAGALRPASTLATAVLPSAPLTAYDVTPAFARLFDRAAAGAGTFLSADAADALGAGPGAAVATAAGDMPVAAVYDYPSDGRRQGLGWAVLRPVTADTGFDECWARAWPPQPQLRAMLAGTLMPAAAGPDAENPEYAQLNAAFGAEFTGHERFLARPTAWAPLMAGGVAALIGFAAVRARRLEFASNLHVGATRGTIMVTALGEAAVWAASAALLVASAVAVLAAGFAPDDVPAVLGEGMKTPMLVFTGALLGTAASLALVRERHLFAYFKDRA
ncbi:hypothetical protein [Agromyces archimandritae]|uniref:FtsX-like permease family protein n=1 Tax=Agromyces archimandritae TaxID=2781962 RepID=A0A975FK56_9MICO|nr:hypothetical protein [Agromyces archimandritae]QTX03535.1 hypothetical protein G127AT_09205 [Agromyces archimandritae]